jgi:hypothetical protein
MKIMENPNGSHISDISWKIESTKSVKRNETMKVRENHLNPRRGAVLTLSAPPTQPPIENAELIKTQALGHC